MIIPTLTTERLTLRGPRMVDFEAYAAFRGSDRARFVGGPNTRGDAWQMFNALIGNWTTRGYGRWIVTRTGDETPLGIVGLHFPIEWPEPEIAWSMFEAGEGHGYAFEAAVASRRYAYDTLGWTTVISLVDAANARSVALARRMGCRPDGVFHHRVLGEMPIMRHLSPQEVAA